MRLMASDKRQDWEALAAKESRGRDLSRETLEGIPLKPVYGPDDAAAIADLHHRAHEACFIANSVTTKVTVEGT